MPATQLKQPFLVEQSRLLEELLEEVENQFTQLTDEQRRWKPSAERWSVAEVFDHLHVTGGKYAIAMEEALTTTIERGWRSGDGPHRPTLMGRFFIRALAGKMKVRAPKSFQPAEAVAELHSVEEYVEQQRDLLAFMQRLDGYSTSRARFPSPVSRLLRFNVGDGIRIMVTHQRRHLQQALHVVEEQGLPRA